ncbi:MAG: Rho termination factor N-terminal domain-containing protein [Bacilli bacterium]|nr:Rho termination factor N-terminal domain-containing protein [Bacilli bacterium]
MKTEKPTVKKEVKTEKTAVKKEVKTDLSKLTVVKLRDMAKTKKITGYSTMKKADLISALQ